MTPWEQALQEGNPLAAAQLSLQAYQDTKTDNDLTYFTFLSQAGTGFAEEAFDVFRDQPGVVGPANGFVSLLLTIAQTGATEVVDQYDLFSMMESRDEEHPGISEFGIRVAAHYLRRDPESPRARLYLHKLLPAIISRQDVNLMRCILLTVSQEDFGVMMQRVTSAFGGVPTLLMPSLARRAEDVAAALFSQVTAEQHGELFPSQDMVWRLTSGAARMADHDRAEAAALDAQPRPELNRTVLAENIAALCDRAARLLAEKQGHPYDKIKAMAAKGLSPVLVLSTGRVGTMAMEGLLRRSETLLPFHFLEYHVETGDQNALLYKLLQPSGAALCDPEIETYLKYRYAELAFCEATGKVPVIVNHLDTVWAPILLGVFPDARLIRMHRSPEKTLLSLALKNQFAFRQLRHLKGRIDAANGRFVYRRDTSLSMEQECAWYMYVTDMLAGLFQAGIARPGRYLDLDMEQVFRLSDDALSRLADFLDDPALTAAVCREAFSSKVNEKTHYTFDPERGDLSRLADVLETTVSDLDRTGTLA